MLEHVKEDIRNSPVVMRGDYPYIVLSLSTGIPRIRPESLKEAVDRMIEISDFDCDVILAPESMGILYGAPISLRIGKPVMMIKKKSFGIDDEVKVSSETGYAKNTFYISCLRKGEKAVIVDDVISTGGTTRSLIKALRRMGVTVTEVICMLDKTKDIKALEKEFGVPIRTVVRMDFVDGRPHVIE